MFIIIFDYNSWYVNIKITLLLKLLKYNHNYIFLSDVLWLKSLLKSTWNLKHFCEPTRPVLVFTPLRLEVEVSTGGARTGARQVGRGTGPSRIYRHHDRRMKRLERMLTEEKKKRRREEEKRRLAEGHETKLSDARLVDDEQSGLLTGRLMFSWFTLR